MRQLIPIMLLLIWLTPKLFAQDSRREVYDLFYYKRMVYGKTIANYSAEYPEKTKGIFEICTKDDKLLLTYGSIEHNACFVGILSNEKIRHQFGKIIKVYDWEFESNYIQHRGISKVKLVLGKSDKKIRKITIVYFFSKGKEIVTLKGLYNEKPLKENPNSKKEKTAPSKSFRS